MNLPSFEEIIRNAYQLLSDAEDVLRSAWRNGFGPNDQQADALDDVRSQIATAKATLTKMSATEATQEAPEVGPVSCERATEIARAVASPTPGPARATPRTRNARRSSA